MRVKVIKSKKITLICLIIIIIALLYYINKGSESSTDEDCEDVNEDILNFY